MDGDANDPVIFEHKNDNPIEINQPDEQVATEEPRITIDEESLCLKCGRCCHRKEIVKGKIVFTKDRCPYLVDKENGETFCDVYDTRLGRELDINGHKVRCILSEQAFNINALPPDCPYVYYYAHPAGSLAKLKSFQTFQQAVKTQDWNGIVPKPKGNCKHCYGRGHEGQNVQTRAYVACRCLR